MTARAPRLTRVDEHVLKHVPAERGARRDEIIATACRTSWFEQALSTREAGEILNGLEAIGRVECRNGWWRRA